MSRGAIVAVVGISIAPAFILWSFQPLKEPLFVFLFVSYVAMCRTWQRVWSQEGTWMARVIVEGIVKPGDPIEILPRESS